MEHFLSWLGKNWIAVVALLISLISAWFAFEQTRISKRIAHLHLEPDIEPMFDLPAQGNPIFVLTNQGDISVASLSILHRVFVFDSSTRKIVSAVEAGRWLGKKMIFKDELKPTEFVSSELVDFSGPPQNIVVYVFHLNFYRSEDMQLYEKKLFYFVKERRVFDHADFRRDPFYPDIMTRMDEFTFPTPRPDPGKLKEVIRAWDKNEPSER